MNLGVDGAERDLFHADLIGNLAGMRLRHVCALDDEAPQGLSELQPRGRARLMRECDDTAHIRDLGQERPVGRKAIAFLRDNKPEWLARLTVLQKDGKVEHRFWQAGGGYDRNAVKPPTVVEMIEYIHNNPVKRGYVDLPEHWRYSSARNYLGQRGLVDVVTDWA